MKTKESLKKLKDAILNNYPAFEGKGFSPILLQQRRERIAENIQMLSDWIPETVETGLSVADLAICYASLAIISKSLSSSRRWSYINFCDLCIKMEDISLPIIMERAILRASILWAMWANEAKAHGRKQLSQILQKETETFEELLKEF